MSRKYKIKTIFIVYDLVYTVLGSGRPMNDKVLVYDFNTFWGISHPWSFIIIYHIFLFSLMIGYYLFKNKRSQTKEWNKKGFFKEWFYGSLTWSISGTMVGFLIQDYNRGLFKVYSQQSEYGGLYFYLSFVLIILLHDTYFYWIHRLLHVPVVYKFVHYHHHKVKTPTAISSYNFSIIEGVLQFLFLPLALLVVPFHVYVIVFFLYFHSFFGVAIHSGYSMVPVKYPWMKKYLTVNNHHDKHHEFNRGNFGLYLNLWDKIMKTEYKGKDRDKK